MDSLSGMFQGTYDPGFQVGKNFKTLNKNVGGGTLANWAVPLAIQRMHKANPGFFSGIDPSVYQKYLGQSSAQTGGYTGSGDGGPDVASYGQQNYQPLPQELKDLFSGVSIQRRGAGGMKDGRTTAMYDAAGNLIHAGDPYKYDPAGDTWKSLGEMGLLAGAAFGGLGLAGAGPLSGLQGVMGGAGGVGASAAGHGAFLGEGIASGIGAWDAAAGLGGLGAGGSMAGAEALGAIGSEAGLGLGGATDGGIGTLASQATAPFSTYAGGPLPTGPGSFSGAMKSALPGLAKTIGVGGGRAGGGGKADDILASLASMYYGNRRQDSAMDLYKSLDNQFAPGSAYEKTMRQELDRRDAAAGRNSQYGPREVELQAKLAEMRSKNATTLAALMDKSNSGLKELIQGGFNLGGDLGLNDIFGSMIGNFGKKIGDEITESDWWNDLFGDD